MVAQASGSSIPSRWTRLSALWTGLRADVRWRDPWRLAGTLVILVVIPWPLWLALSQGSTITGFAEESTGYRYFHTLRLLYGDHERPLLPQGHLVGLVHMGIQILLTALGYPPTQLFPRVDIWAYAAALLPLAVTAAAYVWAVRPLPGPGRLGVALLLVVGIYQIRASTFWHLLQPDYYTWVHVVAMLTIGMMLRLAERSAPVRLRDAVMVGLFAGACLSVKVTWATFPLAVTLLLLARTVWSSGVAAVPLRATSLGAMLRAGGFSVVIAGLAVAVFFGVLLLYHQLDVAAVGEHLAQQNRFLGQASIPRSFQDWFANQIVAWPPDIMALSGAAPAVLAVSVLVLPRRWVSFALLPGTLLALYVAFQRSYTPTFVETNSYALVVVVTWTATVLLPFVREVAASCRVSPARALLVSRIVGSVGVAALLMTVPFQAMNTSRPQLMASLAASTALTHRIERFVNDTPGKTAFFILNNLHRPPTIHTGIAKGGGGMSVFDMTWGVSPLLNQMFPDEAFFFDRLQTGRVNLATYDKFVFGSAAAVGVTAAAAIPSTFEMLNEVYGVAPIGFDCQMLDDLTKYPHLLPVAIVGCQRRPDRRWNGKSNRRVLALPRDGVDSSKPVTLDRRGNSHVVEPGDVVFSMIPNGIWRMDADGGFSRLVAPPKTTVNIANVGPWNARRKRFEGLTVVAAADGRWTAKPVAMVPVNRSNRFQAQGDNPLGDGWWMSSGKETYWLERLQDETGPFVRVHATQALPHLFVTGSDALPGLDGVPVTLRAQIRAQPGSMQTLTAYDFGATGAPTVRADRVLGDGQWRTLVLQTTETRGGNTSDNYTVGLVGVRAGDWFDVREFSLFLGLLPDGDALVPSD